MNRGISAVLIVSILLTPGCIAMGNNGDNDLAENEHSPPVPIVSIDPPSPTTASEITITVEWFSVNGGSHPYVSISGWKCYCQWTNLRKLSY